ncbi:MAG: hypothetical protein DMG28_04530 [Acidobacteria bacterium]|nr:MAG: hypothetical protein DMG28_04530 [Acidobacteriota bacterium]
MIVLWLILALAFTDPQQSTPTPDEQATMQRAQLEHERHRQAVVQLNELAGRIHSEADALAFVDGIADIFADSLPAAWAGPSIRQRVAHAEYEAISDPLRLIPEQRIADVWNEYVREIGAPEEAVVNAAEIHSMRDADYASGQAMWTRGMNESIWTMPNFYATGPDGKISDGCRAIEALRVIYDLDRTFDNLRGARDRLRKGIVASDEIKKHLKNADPNQKTGFRVLVRAELRESTNPLRPAEYRYMREHGLDNFNQLLERLFVELFPSE